MPTIAPATLHTPSLANKLECIATNGSGSFASLAVNGGLGRKFHGLLIHSAIPPMDRWLTWHSCIEEIEGESLDARAWLAGQNKVSPYGERYLTSFSATPMPTWLYNIHGTLLKKELFMVEGCETTVLRYTIIASPNERTSLNLKNFVHFRPAEAYREQLTEIDLTGWRTDETLNTVSAHGLGLNLSCVAPHPSNVCLEWHPIDKHRQTSDLLYAIELEDQGYPQRDASLHVQTVTVSLAVGESCFMVGSLETEPCDPKHAYQQALVNRSHRYQTSDFANDLSHSAIQLIADRASVDGKTLLAGFPWFGDWGRDTMIALPGTTLVTGQFATAQSILKTFAHYLSGGMLPNKFPDRSGDALKYNTIDATLWFFWAIQQYGEYSEDWAFIHDELYEDLKDILRHHVTGTRYGIGIDNDGLIQGGDNDTQLTWMDVKFDGYAVTPRFGKAVEINALWYNALCFVRDCAERFDDHSETYAHLIPKVAESFQKTFWNDASQNCFDYVTPETQNADIRCNQVFAVSLPYSPLTDTQQAAVFENVYRHLYTPAGLRSLSPNNQNYKGSYYGALHERDIAYHQGTVWAWPMGAFIDSAMKVRKSKTFAESLLKGMKQHFYFEAGVHGISEVFDGDAPHAARGCFNQAWSVAEVLRVVDKYDLDA